MNTRFGLNWPCSMKPIASSLPLASHAGLVGFDRCIASAQYHRIAHANAVRLIIGDGYLRQAFQRGARIDQERIHHREALGQPLIGAILALFLSRDRRVRSFQFRECDEIELVERCNLNAAQVGNVAIATKIAAHVACEERT